MKIFGIKIGLNCICYSSKNIPRKNANCKKKYKNGNVNSLLRSGDHDVKKHMPLSLAINEMSKAISRDRLHILTRHNMTRLDNLIYYSENRFGSSHAREYKLMRTFLTFNRDIFVLAVEYEFDEGGCNRQQHGDLILSDGDNIYITECKYIEEDRAYAKTRHDNVNEQALRCHSRFVSWLHHVAKFDTSKECILRMNILPCIITNHSLEKIIIHEKIE